VTSTRFLPTTAENVQAVLTSDTVPIAGQPVTFLAVGTSITTTTSATGVATATLALPTGPFTLTVTYAGDTTHTASSATQPLIVFEPTRFVVWGGGASQLADALPVGQRVVFWGTQWPGVSAPVPAAFSGCADQVRGATWTGRPGNASRPPATIPSYLGALVTTSVDKHGSTITGNVVAEVVLQVENPAAYQPDPGHEGAGTVLGLIDPETVGAAELEGDGSTELYVPGVLLN
jgi:hypothetical protein